jgi:TM2 domain-containing membrane protein YozV
MTDELVAVAPSAHEYMTDSPRTPLSAKSIAVAYVLLVLVGFLGIHQFYLGKISRGALYLPTLGVLGVGLVVDLVTLPTQVRTINARRAIGIR